nr:signal recognition particle receptor subunit [Hymenolepis microstoma]
MRLDIHYFHSSYRRCRIVIQLEILRRKLCGAHNTVTAEQEKLRFGFINKEKSGAAGIIYVIDSTTFQKNFKDVAEYLYDLMTDETLARSRTPFLIACNKTDLPGAKKMDVIEEHLEMELTTLSRTKAEGLASLEGHKETRVPLVKNTNEKFTFASCKHHPVTFVETSVISEDVGPVRLWLERL